MASGGKSEELETQTVLGRLAMIAVGLEDAAELLKSKMKKTVSVTAAIVVGIGLFMAPMEQAQAQVFSPSHITEVTLECVHPSGCDFWHYGHFR